MESTDGAGTSESPMPCISTGNTLKDKLQRQNLGGESVAQCPCCSLSMSVVIDGLCPECYARSEWQKPEIERIKEQHLKQRAELKRRNEPEI